MATNIVTVNFEKAYANLPVLCYNVIEICNYMLQNSKDSDFPPQLLQDIKRILIPQTKLLNLFATSVSDPNENKREEILQHMMELYNQYLQVLRDNYSYISDKIKNSPECQHALDTIQRIGEMSIQYQRSSGQALNAYPTWPEQTHPNQPEQTQPDGQPELSSQPSVITLNDFPPRQDETWVERMWEKACKAIYSLMESLGNMIWSIMGWSAVSAT